MTTAIQDTLKQQNANLEQLKGLLEQELHLISSRDAESLMNVVKEKESLLDDIHKLDTITSTQYQALANEQAPIPDDVTTLIEDAKSLLEECKYRTEINQKAVEQGQLKLSHLRNLLMEIRAKESLTYDKSGKTQGGFMGKGVSA